MHKYIVTEFCEDNSTAVVASAWIFFDNSKTYCYWPSSQYSHAVKHCQAPDPASWQYYACRQLYSTDDYAKARKKAREAEETSNLESEVEGVSKKRNRRHPRAFPGSESSDSDGEQQQPAKRQPTQTLPSTVTKSCHPAPPPPAPPIPATTCTISRPLSPATPMAARETSTPLSTLAASETLQRPASAVSSFERCVLTRLEEVKQSVKEICKTQSLLMAKVDHLMKAGGGGQAMVVDLPDDLVFPVKSVRELQALDRRMADVQLKHSMIANISTIGGSTVKECTRRILRHVLSDACARDVNWKGRGGKLALSELTLSNIISKAVRMNLATAKASNDEVELEMKNWLKFAAERDGGRRQRDANKRSVASASAGRSRIAQQPSRESSASPRSGC